MNYPPFLCISPTDRCPIAEYGKAIPLDTLLEVVMTTTAVRPVSIKIDDDTKFPLKRLANARHPSQSNSHAHVQRSIRLMNR